jgi:hypothetical protein
VDQQQQSRWRPTRSQALWTLGMVAGLTGAVLIGYRYGITLWDWIKLLIVPAVIAGGGLWFNRQQQDRQREDEQRQQERGLEIENQRAQDEALQAYLDQMSQLLIDNDLLSAQVGDASRSVARARTLTVLPTLDNRRKRSILQFLFEAGLIDKDSAIVDLKGAYLSRANLSRTNLSEANLIGAYLSSADLSSADLFSAYLREADLRGAKGVTNEQLSAATSLEGVTMPDGQKYEDWFKSKGREEDGENSSS